MPKKVEPPTELENRLRAWIRLIGMEKPRSGKPNAKHAERRTGLPHATCYRAIKTQRPGDIRLSSFHRMAVHTGLPASLILRLIERGEPLPFPEDEKPSPPPVEK